MRPGGVRARRAARLTFGGRSIKSPRHLKAWRRTMVALPRAGRWALIFAMMIAAGPLLPAQNSPGSGLTWASDPSCRRSPQPAAIDGSGTMQAGQPIYSWPACTLGKNPFLSADESPDASTGSDVPAPPPDRDGGMLASRHQFAPGTGAALADHTDLSSTGQASVPVDAQVQTTEGRQVSWKLIVPNFLSDQKRIWLFPLSLAEGHHWVPTIPIVASTGGLIIADPFLAPYFRNTSRFYEFNHVFKDPTTEWVFLGLPVLWYFGGLAGHSKYAQQTGFLAAETLVDVDFLAGVMRSVDGRLHPRDIPLPQNGGDYTHTWFKAKGTYVNRGSFPSGHTAGAFAAATVFSRRYGRRHRWVPWLSYSLATVTGFSRVSWSAHFPSDVFLGATLSYVIGRYVVLRNQEEPLTDNPTGQ